MASFSKTKLNQYLFLAIVMTIGIVSIAVSYIQKRSSNDIRSKAAGMTGPVRGQSGDLWADIILGKQTFNDVVPNSIAPNKTFYPRSVIVDRSNPTSNKAYVYDGSNSRILGIDLNNCLAHSGDPLNCSADIIIGQPASHPSDSGFGNTAGCNGDSGFQNYPNRATASATTLCSMPESQLSVGENGTGSNMFTDDQGNLYLTDSYNHRVLMYNSPFNQTGAITASQVWGQSDFTGNQCNKGQASPDASTLCFGWSGNNNMSAGVDVDTSGNVWVADSANNRVLRFPPGSKTADLVIGQIGFTTKTSGAALNQLYAPTAVRMLSTGQLLVVDNSNNRVLMYTAPFTNGMTGSIFAPTATFSSPTGLNLDPTQPGKVWINNQGHQTVELWDVASQTKVRTLGVEGNGNVINVSSGSVGIDSNGNVFVGIKGGNYGDDVVEYSAQGPYDFPSHQLFGGQNVNNQRDQYGLEGGNQVLIAGNQLIVADIAGVSFWNIDPSNPPSTLKNGKPADGYIVRTSFNQRSNGLTFGMRASANHLYVARSRRTGNNAGIAIYNLPLTSGEQESAPQIALPLNVLGGGQVNYNTNDDQYWSVLPAADDSYLWVTDANNSRVLRIRNPLTNPMVDVILGQNDANGTLCNRTGNPGIDALPNTLCWPGWISADRQNNFYVSDWSPENRGNWRLLEFNNSIFPVNNPNVIYAPSPSKIFINTAVAEIAFDSQNHMVAGYQRYYNLNPSGYEFPGIYMNPLAPAPVPPAQIQPDDHLKDYSSAAFTSFFDSNDNLYVGDWARNRVEVYLSPLNNAQILTPTPGNPTATSIPPSPTSIPPSPTSLPPTATPLPSDTQPPVVSFINPLNGGFVARNSTISMQASASDNVGVTRVEFYLNNSLKCSDTTSPFTCTWRVPGKQGIRYTIQVRAYDAANNMGTATITVTSK